MKTTDLNITPFHKVDMSSYLSDPSYESAMVPFCKFAIECVEHLLIECADQLTPTCVCIDCILDGMDVLVSIENYCNMYLTRNTSGYEQFYLPKWFLMELLKEECKQRAFDLIPFTISLFRECK
jgi:hypothetical protein